MALYRTDQFVKSVVGPAIAGAHIYWLTQPVINLPSSEQLGGPTPQALTFTDSTGGTVLPQPIITDGFGHVDAYLAPGTYTLAVYNNGTLMATYPDQTVGIGAVVTSLNGLTGALSIAAGSGINITVVGSSIIVSNALSPGTTAQPGDILRFNTNGDGIWDAVRYTQSFCVVTANLGSNTPNIFGITGSVGVGSFGTAGTIFATQTNPGGLFYGLSATGSGVCQGMQVGQNGSGSINFPLRSSYRTAFYVSLLNIGANCRYWFGLANYQNSASHGTNNQQIVNTAKFAVDTPNSDTIAFRFSGGLDTDYQAVCAVAGVGATVVDTGVVADTNPHLFEFCPDQARATINFFIDHAFVCNIATNVPGVRGGTMEDYGTLFWTIDNKNQAAAPKIGFYFMETAPRYI